MATISKDAQQRSAAAAVKAERALDKVTAMQEYEAEQVALRANTERLRALRLAKEAQDLQDISTQQPAKKKAVQVIKTQESAKKKTAVKRVSVPKRAGGKPPKLS
jgi:LmbE family N-acetylglucosaminyl deacetylase